MPEGDFSVLPDLPKMYADCKATEDPDMNIPDFITEHLLEVDGLFGQDKTEPDEKPHQPVQFHHQFVHISITVKQFDVELQQTLIQEHQLMAKVEHLALWGYTAAVFRPPIG